MPRGGVSAVLDPVTASSPWAFQPSETMSCGTGEAFKNTGETGRSLSRRLRVDPVFQWTGCWPPSTLTAGIGR